MTLEQVFLEAPRFSNENSFTYYLIGKDFLPRYKAIIIYSDDFTRMFKGKYVYKFEYKKPISEIGPWKFSHSDTFEYNSLKDNSFLKLTDKWTLKDKLDSCYGFNFEESLIDSGTIIYTKKEKLLSELHYIDDKLSLIKNENIFI